MPRPRGSSRHARPTYNQAYKVVTKFGSEAKLAKLLGTHRTTIYRWYYAAPGGTDGLVPVRNIDRINAIARLDGVLLTEYDWLPERNQWGPDGTLLNPPRPGSGARK